MFLWNDMSAITDYKKLLQVISVLSKKSWNDLIYNVLFKTSRVWGWFYVKVFFP